MSKSYRCYVDAEGLTHTITGKRKILRTDAVPTHCCSLEVFYFVWEKSVWYKGELIEGWSGYVSPSQVEFIDKSPN